MTCHWSPRAHVPMASRGVMSKAEGQTVLKTAAGLVVFLGFDATVRGIIQVSGLSMLPSQICSASSNVFGSSYRYAVFINEPKSQAC